VHRSEASLRETRPEQDRTCHGKPPRDLITCFDADDRPVEKFRLDDVVAILVAQPPAGTASVPGDQS